jgi:SAM-dependent methyltransferase
MTISLIIESSIVEDATSKNALHKLVTDYAWIYDQIYPGFLKQMKKQNDLLASRLKKSTRITLELGAGTARQSWLLKRNGFESYAIERSPQMIEVAAGRIGKDRIQTGDIRDFRCSKLVDAVVIGPLTTCYLLNDDDVLKTLESSVNNLSNTGIFMAEFIPTNFMISDPFFHSISRQDFKIQDGRIIRFNECQLELNWNARYDWKSSYIFELNSGVSSGNDFVTLRSFSPSEVIALSNRSGLQVIDLLGFDGNNLVQYSKGVSYSAFLVTAKKNKK